MLRARYERTWANEHMAIELKTRVKKCRELVMYCIIGCTGAGLDFALYTALTDGVGFHYQLANFSSVSFGIINNFLLNYFFNFRTKDRMFIRLVSFYVVGMAGWTLSAICLWLFIEQFAMSAIVAKLGTIAFVTVVQFCLNKFITFKKLNKEECHG